MSAAIKLAIHELLARSALALDERDVPALRATFSKDANLSILIGTGEERTKSEPLTFTGRDAIMELMVGSMESQSDLRRHVISNLFFEALTSKEARAVCYLLIYSIEAGAIRCVSSGLYRDHVVLKKSGWKIAERLIDLDLPY